MHVAPSFIVLSGEEVKRRVSAKYDRLRAHLMVLKDHAARQEHDRLKGQIRHRWFGRPIPTYETLREGLDTKEPSQAWSGRFMEAHRAEIYSLAASAKRLDQLDRAASVATEMHLSCEDFSLLAE